VSDDETTASIHSTYPASIASHRRASSTRRRAEREALARTLAHPYRPSYTLDSPSNSYGSGEDSAFSEDDSVPFYDEKAEKRRSKRASRRSALLRVEAPVEEEPHEEQQSNQHRVSAFVSDPSGASKEMNSKEMDSSYVPTRHAEALEWTPTCGQSMRRRWQAVALRFRFSVFRAKRNVRRRVRGA
jgi:hypothetical protein